MALGREPNSQGYFHKRHAARLEHDLGPLDALMKKVVVGPAASGDAKLGREVHAR
jgi:hypothetical protein